MYEIPWLFAARVPRRCLWKLQLAPCRENCSIEKCTTNASDASRWPAFSTRQCQAIGQAISPRNCVRDSWRRVFWLLLVDSLSKGYCLQDGAVHCSGPSGTWPPFCLVSAFGPFFSLCRCLAAVDICRRAGIGVVSGAASGRNSFIPTIAQSFPPRSPSKYGWQKCQWSIASEKFLTLTTIPAFSVRGIHNPK